MGQVQSISSPQHNNNKDFVMRCHSLRNWLALSFIASQCFYAAQSLANTDIFLANIKLDKTSATLTQVKNISNRAGYDNQPNFAPDSQGLYYTAMFQLNDKQFQADTLHYDLKQGTTKNISQTWHTSEYSPTPIEQGKRLSFIKVEEDGNQRLWSMDIKTAQQTIINDSIQPVGYHAWGQKQDLALFVLGEPMTLQYIHSPNQNKGQHVADNIGRSIRYNEKHQVFSYSFGEIQQTLAIFNPAKSSTEVQVPLPTGAEYYTWFDSETVLSAEGAKIKAWRYRSADKDWRLFVDASQYCQTKVSRLAVSPDKTKLAFVCDETE